MKKSKNQRNADCKSDPGLIIGSVFPEKLISKKYLSNQ